MRWVGLSSILTHFPRIIPIVLRALRALEQFSIILEKFVRLDSDFKANPSQAKNKTLKTN